MWQSSLTFFTVFDRELVHSYLLHTLSLVCDSLFYMTDCLLWRTIFRWQSVLHDGLSFVTDSFRLQSVLHDGLSFVTDSSSFRVSFTPWTVFCNGQFLFTVCFKSWTVFYNGHFLFPPQIHVLSVTFISTVISRCSQIFYQIPRTWRHSGDREGCLRDKEE